MIIEIGRKAADSRSAFSCQPKPTHLEQLKTDGEMLLKPSHTYEIVTSI